MDDPEILARFAVVLARPKSAGNVGSVARAMKNLGFRSLRIVGPARYDDPGYFDREAGRMAWDAADVLAARRESAGIEDAIADAVLVAGTTSRPPRGVEALDPRALAARLLDAAAAGTVALLLARENTGLTKDDLSRCQVLGTIPASAAYPSLNLAQAALVFLYEIRLAALARQPPTAPPPAVETGARTRGASDEDEEPPRQEELERFHLRLGAALEAIGFFEGSGRAHMDREIRRLFGRAIATRRDLRILEGVARCMTRRPRGAGPPRKG